LSPSTEYAPGTAHFPALKSATIKLTRLGRLVGHFFFPKAGADRMLVGFQSKKS
jgi:hypothetical protein